MSQLIVSKNDINCIEQQFFLSVIHENNLFRNDDLFSSMDLS